MSYSLNEVEALVKRAAYASGYAWGLAEESAKATRWLCTFRFNGCEIVSTVLKQRFAIDQTTHILECEGQVWRGNDVVCPIATGATLSDYSSRLLTGPITIRKVSIPQMILPFVGLSAIALGKVLTLKCKNNLELNCVTNGNELEFFGQFPASETDLIIKIDGEVTNPISRVSRAQPSTRSWDYLNELANLTYAPASEESRSLGAGSSAEDSD